MTDAEPRVPNKRLPNLKLDAQGAITNHGIERFALFLADGLELFEAWKLLGKKNSGGSVEYRGYVLADPVFKQRMEVLLSEKSKLEEDPVWGEATWMINQLWRDARANGDPALMKEAATLRYKVAQNKHDMILEDQRRAGSPAEPSRGPGKPVTDTPQSRVDMQDIRSRLVNKGMKAVPGEDDEDAAA